MPKAPENLKDIRALVEIVAALRGPDGCPWDKEQTHRTLTRYAIEETHEMIEALEYREEVREKQAQQTERQQANHKFKDELGDVLFQVLLHASMAEEVGDFNFTDVMENLAQKLVRRHPHVFSGVKVSGIDEVWANWDEIKKAEKAARGEKAAYLKVTESLPALQRAYEIGRKTEKIKFDWTSPEEVWVKVEEEYAELQEAMDNDVMSEVEHELGDVFFSLAQLARHYDLDPEQVLRAANRRFLGRFEKMMEMYAAAETKASKVEDVLSSFSGLSLEEKEKFWQLAKKALKK